MSYCTITWNKEEPETENNLEFCSSVVKIQSMWPHKNFMRKMKGSKNTIRKLLIIRNAKILLFGDSNAKRRF